MYGEVQCARYYGCVSDRLSKLSLAGRRIVRFPRYRDGIETMTSARFLNGRFWKQTEGETRCHRRCRILPGDRFARQNAEALYQKGRHSLPATCHRSRRSDRGLYHFLLVFSLKRRRTQREQSRMPRSRRSKILPALNTLRCTYDCARTFRNDGNEIHYGCTGHFRAVSLLCFAQKFCNKFCIESLITWNLNGSLFTTVCNLHLFRFWSRYDFDTVRFRRYKYEQSYFAKRFYPTSKRRNHFRAHKCALKCECAETAFHYAKDKILSRFP